MTVTLRGYQGTVSDADMAVMLPRAGSGRVDSAAALAVTAVGGNRQVSVAAGSATTPFQRYTSDVAQTLTLAPPTSGGKFYGIALNRQWSPANTAVLEAVDLGITTDGTVPAPAYMAAPAVIPSAAAITAGKAANPAALPGSIRNSPGSGSSAIPAAAGYGAHQLLAIVHVRAADTTLTVIDTRLIEDTQGEVVAATYTAVWWAGLFHTPLRGTVLACAEGISYRWNGTAWTPWDSDWMPATFGVAGFVGGYGDPNGWVSVGSSYRFRAGRVVFAGSVACNGPGAVGGQIAIGLPYGAAKQFQGTPLNITMDAYRPTIPATYVLNGGVNGGFCYLGWTNGSGQNFPTGPTSPFAWTQQDTIEWLFEYDPA